MRDENAEKQVPVGLANNNPIIELSSSRPEEIEIHTTDDIKKTDGVITIGEVNNNQYVAKEVILPPQIDLQQRKNAIQEKQNQVKKKKQKIVTSEQKKASTITSLIVIAIVGLLIGTYYYFKNRETAADFQLKNITVELGEKLSTDIKTYIDRKDIDELAYKLNITKVNNFVVGEYEYSVSHADVTKKGKIIVKDTIPPIVKTKEESINLNDSYTVENLIESCEDISGCIYQFADGTETKIASNLGIMTVNILVKDIHDNEKTIKVSFIVVDNSNITTCRLEKNTNDYLVIEVMKMTFDVDNMMSEGKRTITRVYNNQKAYAEFKVSYSNISSYSFDDEELSSIKSENYQSSFYELKNRQELTSYFENSNYSCQ